MFLLCSSYFELKKIFINYKMSKLIRFSTTSCSLISLNRLKSPFTYLWKSEVINSNKRGIHKELEKVGELTNNKQNPNSIKS